MWQARVGVLLVGAALGTTSTGAAQSPGTFVQTGTMTVSRSFHSATLLPNGEVLIAGGGSDDSLASAEIYVPRTSSFRPVGSMTTARRVHTATLLPDERVLIVGGYEGSEALASAELYDPAAQTFRPTGGLITARGGHTAILLTTGEVLMIGGYGTRAYPNLAPAEIYDPASGVFRAAGAYVGRGGCDFCAPAVLLHDGTVLFAGQSPAQIYDRARDAFSPSGVMAFEPSAAAALASGQVLFAGGESLGPPGKRGALQPGDRGVHQGARHDAAARVAHADRAAEWNGPGRGRRNRRLLRGGPASLRAAWPPPNYTTRRSVALRRPAT